MGEAWENAGERRLRKSLHVPAVDKSPAASTKGVVSVHRCLIEGASRKWCRQVNVVTERIGALLIDQPVGEGQSGQIPVGNRSGEFAERSGVRGARNVIGVTCSTSPSGNQCTTLILDNRAMF